MLNPSGNLTSTNIALCNILFRDGVLPPGRVAGRATLCVVNMISSLFAIMANILVIWAIKKTPSLHSPSSALLCVLAASDFAVGTFIQPLAVIHGIGIFTNNFRLYCVSGSILLPSAIFLGGCSFVTMTAISVERYLALTLHLRYAAIVTVNRVLKCIFPICIFFLTLMIMSFWLLRTDWYRTTIASVGLFTFIVCTFAIPFSYYRIFKILRRHRQQIHDQTVIAKGIHGLSHINVSKYRKSVFTFLYVLGALLLTYLPFEISLAMLWTDYTEYNKFVFSITGTLVLLNSSINPVVYCWRIKEIRRFVVLKLRSVFGAEHST